MSTFKTNSLLASALVALLATGLAPTLKAVDSGSSASSAPFPFAADTSAVTGEQASSSYNKAENSTLIALVDAAGNKIWEVTIPMKVLPVFDAAGNLFYKSETTVMAMDRANGSIKWTFARTAPIVGEHIYYIETYGDDVFVTYGIQPTRYPSMGIVRLDSETGSLYWDVWVGTSVTLRGVENGQLVTNGPFASGPFYYKL